MALISLSDGSFLPSSRHQFPFVLNFSVLVGDSILLPIFNGYFYRLVVATKQQVARHWRLALAALLTAASVSTYGQLAVHQAWTQDQYTGFLDTELGKLSLAGWWHMGFATIETSVVMMYVVLWAVGARAGLGDAHRAARSGWCYLVGFALLGALDFVTKWDRVYGGLSLSEMLANDWYFLLVIMITAGILVLAGFIGVARPSSKER